MTDARELRCLIAAGGTTGDVLPALAGARRRARWRRLRGRPDGLRRLARGHPQGLDGGGRARWPRQPPRGSLRGACVPVVPGRRQGAAEVPRHRPADPGKVAAVAPGREPRALRAAGVGTGAARLRRQPGRPQPERADRTCGWVRTPLMSSSGSTGQFRRPHEQSSRVLKAAPPSRRLGDRRLWFVGIGGAGLSGYALLAKAWGAEVAGWDRVETPYLEHVRATGIPVTIEAEPAAAPDSFEAVVSTAFAGRVPGRTRAELLAELVSLQDSIVVAGAHGKTTTAAMIAFVLDRLGQDPAFLIGGDVPQLGGNARAGGGWLVVEGDESDRTVFSLPAEIAVVTNVDLDHHATFASAAELEELFERWAAGMPHVVWGRELVPLELELAVP